MGNFLHPHVQFFLPLSNLSGKETVLEAAKGAVARFNTLTIRTKFREGNQVMLVHDLDFPEPIGHFPTAVLMTFNEGLIARIELFYDARPLVNKGT